MMNNLLSLCMIVKNEENVLRRCLESVKNLVDEIIIVDTGSTDNTKQIASEFTNNIYDFQWINDFSAARNESLRKASGQWILVLDADEYVQQGNIHEFKNFLSNLNSTEPTGLLLPILNVMGHSANNSRIVESSGARVFPNLLDIYYTRPIHEQLTHKRGNINFIKYPFFINHTGYTDEIVRQKDKSNRNLQIFESFQNSGSQLDPYYCFTIANEYQSIGDHKKALYYYQRAYKRAKSNDSWLPHCLDSMINTLFILDRLADALELIQKYQKQWKQYTDYYCLEGIIYDHLGLYDLASQKFKECIRIAEEFDKKNSPFSLVSPDYGYLIPYQKLSEIYYRQNNIPQTVFYLSKLLNLNPNNLPVLYKLVNLFCHNEQPSSIITFLEQFYSIEVSNNAMLLFHTTLLIGHEELAKHYYQRSLDLNIELIPLDLLRFALLFKDKALFDQYLKSVHPTLTYNQASVHLLYLASLIWHEQKYLEMIPIQSHLTIHSNIKAIINQDDTSPNSDITEELFSIIIDLYKLKHYETFDLIMNHLSNPVLINLIADFFYTNNQFDLALDFYSNLLNNSQLHASGYENLAFLYLNQGIVDEGLEFLERAIHLLPTKASLYLLFCNYCTDARRQLVKNKFIDLFPHYKRLLILIK
ncbi:glycosyltransferase involved in cell wall biosynthesis [Paenibacillus sp. V4I3]|uniref:glycosyltransferase family 2 protein n=1 Tax=Paenibacillus sp. V4I3 TaxID=3042305 RepID=UPI0027871E7D|nr:glycosyltransferase family 2 protein [Paenibacillus sp. V4I3]MDQ0872140.1 glycosyltransferase involved in cell wall biosynthesis [Paenibacillus sp. V4I3]